MGGHAVWSSRPHITGVSSQLGTFVELSIPQTGHIPPGLVDFEVVFTSGSGLVKILLAPHLWHAAQKKWLRPAITARSIVCPSRRHNFPARP